MRKILLDGILIVEGKQDKAFLSNFIKSPILILNGLDIKSPTISIMKKYSDNVNFLVLTDPDKAGANIKENLLNEKIKFIPLYLKNNESVRGKKHGVAECKTENILELLSPYKVQNQKSFEINNALLMKYDLCGPNSSQNRKKVCDFLGIDYLSGKSFKYLLEILKISDEDLGKVLLNHGN